MTRFLVPIFKPGDVVVLDNLGSHKGAAIRRAIESVGARLWFLPPYSPDLNPTEQACAKVKRRLRQAQACTPETLIAQTADVIDRFSPAECNNSIENVGYGSMRT